MEERRGLEVVKQKVEDSLRKRQKCKRKKYIMELEKELKEERNVEEREESERKKQRECGKEGEMGRLPVLPFSSLDR